MIKKIRTNWTVELQRYGQDGGRIILKHVDRTAPKEDQEFELTAYFMYYDNAEERYNGIQDSLDINRLIQDMGY